MAVYHWLVHSPAVNYCSSKRRPFAWRETATRGPESFNFDSIASALCWLETSFTKLQYMPNSSCQTVYAAPIVVIDQHTETALRMWFYSVNTSYYLTKIIFSVIVTSEWHNKVTVRQRVTRHVLNAGLLIDFLAWEAAAQLPLGIAIPDLNFQSRDSGLSNSQSRDPVGIGVDY